MLYLEPEINWESRNRRASFTFRNLRTTRQLAAHQWEAPIWLPTSCTKLMLKPCTNGKPLNDWEPCDFDRMPIVSQIRHPLAVGYPIPTLTKQKDKEVASTTNFNHTNVHQPQPCKHKPISRTRDWGHRRLTQSTHFLGFPSPQPRMSISTTGGSKILTLVNETTIKAFDKTNPHNNHQ